MVKYARFVVLVCLLYATNPIKAQIGEICNWDGGKKAAVVLTFDDWTPGQYPVVTPELKKRNINATFFVITNNIATWNHSWPDVITSIKDGNEIANHTKSHPKLDVLNSQYVNPTNYPSLAVQLKEEVEDAKNYLELNLKPYKVETFAYPFGNTNAEIIDFVKATGHIAARGANRSTSYPYHFAATENDYYNTHTFAMGPTITTAAFFAEINKAIEGGGMLTYLYHSMDNSNNDYSDNWYAQVQQVPFQHQLDTMLTVKDKIWITTYAQAIKYHKEKNCATLSQVQPPTEKQWVVSLTDTLKNNSIYNQPLSIKLKMNGKNYKKSSQNGHPLHIDAITNETIMFRAVPDGGDIILSD